ncbi:hypothetical protein [Virgibacillus litoralis]|uniref:Yip1 domain-containing protein n=1 Tax=Virgibacillus litoralis TaxID=578221 RepID=A0ABS4HGL3_9BACI|nr:hypothetical protein [Virgibacillus litoralis]MBP1950065.1 hypothetical protein [Virgibacillus litoralis]
MIYPVNILKFLFPLDDHLYRVHKTETLKNLWKIVSLLVLFCAIVYAWMAILGIGSDIISGNATAFNLLEYEESKFWFILGRIGFAIVFALLVLFVPSYLFYLITGIPYQKLLIMQEVVLLVLLIERVIWIPLVVYFGLDWFVSPLSFGVIASYFTDIPWVVFFFGAISLFQLWIIWFQVKFLSYMAPVRKRWIWFSVTFLHIIYWAVVAALAFMDIHMISGWFE